MAYKECFVKKCGNNTATHPEKLFLTVPKNKQRRQNWFCATNFTDESRLKSNRLYCCEDHFDLPIDAVNWMRFKMCGNNLILRDDVVPHKNVEDCNENLPVAHESQLSNSAKKRKAECILHIEQSLKVSKTPCRELTNIPEPDQEDMSIEPRLIAGQTAYINNKKTPEKQVQLSQCDLASSRQEVIAMGTIADTSNINVGTSPLRQKRLVSRAIQTKLKKKFRSVYTNTIPVKHTSQATSCCMEPVNKEPREILERQQNQQPALSGTSSHSDLTVVESLFSSFTPSTEGSSKTNWNYGDTRLRTTLILMETKSRFYLGVPEEVYIFVTQVTQHTSIPYRNVFITIKKIRLGDPYVRLADDFGMSVSNVQKIFTECVPKIADVVQELIFWPESLQIQRTLPIAFRARYKSVESIIDCLEIEIEKPSDSLRQALTWSDYKKCNTVKFLISSTPAGFVNFMSGAYGGRTSDKEILKLSGYLDVLPDGASVLADRGFKHVAPLLTIKKCKLIRPPSVVEGEKLSRLQVKQNRTIASLRVHIERVIRRLREFEMLGPHSCLHHHLLYLINHMVIIACGIINIQGPLLKK